MFVCVKSESIQSISYDAVQNPTILNIEQTYACYAGLTPMWHICPWLSTGNIKLTLLFTIAYSWADKPNEHVLCFFFLVMTPRYFNVHFCPCPTTTFAGRIIIIAEDLLEFFFFNGPPLPGGSSSSPKICWNSSSSCIFAVDLLEFFFFFFELLVKLVQILEVFFIERDQPLGMYCVYPQDCTMPDVVVR